VSYATNVHAPKPGGPRVTFLKTVDPRCTGLVIWHAIGDNARSLDCSLVVSTTKLEILKFKQPRLGSCGSRWLTG
jgi:hypothetical protein